MPKVAIVAGAILALAAVASILPQGGSRADEPSSSYSTGATGLGAYAELLRRFDHPVRRLRGAIDAGVLDATETLVILDAPGLSAVEADRVRSFVHEGGRLVAGGFGVEHWLEAVTDDVPGFEGDPVTAAEATGPAPEVDGVGRVRLGGFGASFDTIGSLEPLLREQGGDVVVAAAGDVGEGRVVVLSDATALQNGLLGMADNAAFGLGVAGPEGRPVAFAEGPHGYGTSEGLSALPGRWRVMLAGLAVAVAVWLLARASRLGPPEEEARPLGPRRRAYVDALAGTLTRTGRPLEVVEPVRRRARGIVAARAGLPPDAPDDAIRAGGLRLGLPADEADALVGLHSEAAVVAVGRALARLEPGATPEQGGRL